MPWAEMRRKRLSDLLQTGAITLPGIAAEAPGDSR